MTLLIVEETAPMCRLIRSMVAEVPAEPAIHIVARRRLSTVAGGGAPRRRAGLAKEQLVLLKRVLRGELA